MRVGEAGAVPSGRRWKKRFMGSVARFPPRWAAFSGTLWFLCAINTDTEDQLERRWQRERNEYNTAGEDAKEREGEKEIRAKEIAGRARVETRKKDVGIADEEEKSGVERAILSPSKCFLFEKWSFMGNGVRYESGRLITFVWSSFAWTTRFRDSNTSSLTKCSEHCVSTRTRSFYRREFTWIFDTCIEAQISLKRIDRTILFYFSFHCTRITDKRDLTFTMLYIFAYTRKAHREKMKVALFRSGTMKSTPRAHVSRMYKRRECYNWTAFN